MHDEELQNLHPSPNISRMSNTRRIGWAGTEENTSFDWKT
jgi:hypothetical protein